jgi:hypothetical protein
MGIHSDYGKHVMRAAAGSAFEDWGASVEVSYGAGSPARIDGTVGNLIAVEVESRVAKQVRGAVLDLISHPFPKKLLVLEPVHMHDPEGTAAQCRNILGRFLNAADFRVVVLRGSGDSPELAEDAALVRTVLTGLGWSGSSD